VRATRRLAGSEDLGVDPGWFEAQAAEGGRQVGEEGGWAAQMGVGVGREAEGGERLRARSTGRVQVSVGGPRVGIANVPVGVGQPGEQGVGLGPEGVPGAVAGGVQPPDFARGSGGMAPSRCRSPSG